MTFPDDCRYTSDHEWVRLDGDTATIGITDYAQGELGDIVFVEFDAGEGDSVEAEAAFGTVEAVKTVSELFAPVSGTVAEINGALDGAPELVNSDPYGEGWMVKITVADAASVDALMDAATYKEMVGA